MILFLKYLFSSLLMAAAVALLVAATNLSASAMLPGARFSSDRLSLALVLGLTIFVFLLAIFPALVRVAQRRNPQQVMTLTSLHSAQMQILSSFKTWTNQRLLWILGGAVVIALTLAVLDSLGYFQ